MQVTLKKNVGKLNHNEIEFLLDEQKVWMREAKITQCRITTMADYPNNLIFWHFENEADASAFALKWL